MSPLTKDQTVLSSFNIGEYSSNRSQYLKVTKDFRRKVQGAVTVS